MTERNEQQKAADKFRESLRERIQRLPLGVTVEVWTSASTTSGNVPFDKQTLREVGVGRVPEVRMLAAQIGADRHGYADLEVGARPVRALFFLNMDEVELRGVTLEEGQNEWPGMMDDVRRWARGVSAEALIRADQEGWARTVEWESRAAAEPVLPLGDLKVYHLNGQPWPASSARETLEAVLRTIPVPDGWTREGLLADWEGLLSEMKHRADNPHLWPSKYGHKPAPEIKP